MRRRHKSKFDYYHELGVHEDATYSEIKNAYRKLAKEFHPDKLHGTVADGLKAEKRFKRIAEAYEVLSDVDLKSEYDYHEHPGVCVDPKDDTRKPKVDVETVEERRQKMNEDSRPPFADFIKDDAVKNDKPFTSYEN